MFYLPISENKKASHNYILYFVVKLKKLQMNIEV